MLLDCMIYIKLPVAGKRAYPEDWNTQQITQGTHVQTHMQSTVPGYAILTLMRFLELVIHVDKDDAECREVEGTILASLSSSNNLLVDW